MAETEGIDPSGVTIYESVPTDPPCSLVDDIYGVALDASTSTKEEIDSTPNKPRASIIKEFVTSSELSFGETLEGRIAYIQELISQLGAETNDTRVSALERSLESIVDRCVYSIDQPSRSSCTKQDSGPQPMELPQSTLCRIQDLESRLLNLERVCGFPAETPGVSIKESLDAISHKLDLTGLASEHIEQAAERLSKIGSMSEPSVASAVRIDDLWRAFESISPLIENLPQLTGRLRSLAVLHEHSAVSVKSKLELADSLKTLSKELDGWKIRLDHLEASLSKSSQLDSQ